MKGSRVILSEYPILKTLLLDVLNFKNEGTLFTSDDVAKGVKEKFKRFDRKFSTASTILNEQAE